MRFQGGELVIGRLGLGVDRLQVARFGAGFLPRAGDGEARVGDLLVEISQFILRGGPRRGRLRQRDSGVLGLFCAWGSSLP